MSRVHDKYEQTLIAELTRLSAIYGLTGELVKGRKHAKWVMVLADGSEMHLVIFMTPSNRDGYVTTLHKRLRKAIFAALEARKCT